LERLALLQTWLDELFPGHANSLMPASSDASFRRYFRLAVHDTTYIVMDAPPDKEDCRAFIHVAGLMAAAGLNVPHIMRRNLTAGFLLLTDLGSVTYLDALKGDKTHELFLDAIDALITWQLATRPDQLPSYDEALLRRELNLFPDWYVAHHLNLELTAAQRERLQAIFTLVLQRNLAQPTVFVHRDYMPRNLMLTTPNPGILDFQDAVVGPITYDIASLFRDAFISWDEEQILDWTIRYWERAKKVKLPVRHDFAEFYRDFEWMGLQRHLKVAGIFSRINYRDGKSHYLSDIPRFSGYIRHTCRRYGALTPLLKLLDEIEGAEAKMGYTF
jgi:aminoglycoside/choline kinase family phosphotransferase